MANGRQQHRLLNVLWLHFLSFFAFYIHFTCVLSHKGIDSEVNWMLFKMNSLCVCVCVFAIRKGLCEQLHRCKCQFITMSFLTLLLKWIFQFATLTLPQHFISQWTWWGFFYAHSKCTVTFHLYLDLYYILNVQGYGYVDDPDTTHTHMLCNLSAVNVQISCSVRVFHCFEVIIAALNATVMKRRCM